VSIFRVWAPAAAAVSVVTNTGTDEVTAMAAAGGGWWRAEVPSAGPGTDYAFLLDSSADELPDPRSAWQPHGVHGRSRLVDHGAFGWTDGRWRGVPLAGSVLYELHVGTFTPAGTFDAAARRLDHLADLGVDAVELLPVAAFPGRHGWGYDGVDLFAVHDAYGGPDGLRRFVDAAHARGIGVVMDVVHNHLGPDGNYLARFGPYFTDTYATPWGPAVNLDGFGSDEVRRFVVDNALMWLRDYHCDGLRLDAVHALLDRRAVHVLEEIGTAVRHEAARAGRTMFVIAESDLNDPRVVQPLEAGGYQLDSQWADDIHHALWAALSGERQGYYADFGTLPTLAKALEKVFVHDGTYSTFRGRKHGRAVPDGMPRHRFVASLQNHDQIGNRAVGDRAAASLSPGLLRVGAALLLTAPFTPMLFMGEEWGATTPWAFFTDHTDPGLADAVRSGRRAEFATHGWAADDVPDPQDEATFRASALDWAERDRPAGAGLLAWYRQLIALRRAIPDLGGLAPARCEYDADGDWFVMYRGRLAVICNLTPERRAVPVVGEPRETLLSSTPGFTCLPGRVDLDGEACAIIRLA
jgi:maltooligosyltrehalose trehalohydrolase